VAHRHFGSDAVGEVRGGVSGEGPKMLGHHAVQDGGFRPVRRVRGREAERGGSDHVLPALRPACPREGPVFSPPSPRPAPAPAICAMAAALKRLEEAERARPIEDVGRVPFRVLRPSRVSDADGVELVCSGVAPVLHLPSEATRMPTAKKRVAIAVDDSTYEALERLSRKRRQSVAGVSLHLIEEAIEYQEDRHFSRIADERLSKPERRIPHGKAWG
jgi:hypothetical protein